MTGIVILFPAYMIKTNKQTKKQPDIQKGLRILQVNCRTKIYTQVQIPCFHYSTTIIGDIFIDNP